MLRTDSGNSLAWDRAVEILGKDVVVALSDREWVEVEEAVKDVMASDTVSLDDAVAHVQSLPSSERTLGDLMMLSHYDAMKETNKKARQRMDDAARERSIKRNAHQS